MNAVIYARFSASGQNEQSIESQIRTCREFAESQGYNVVNTYSDKARTGTNDSRPSFQLSVLSGLCFLDIGIQGSVS